MAFISMTGYGRGDALSGGNRVEVELSSVNRKQFDVRVSLPREFAALESRFKDVVHGVVSRGYVNGTVRIESVSQGGGRHKAMAVDVNAARHCLRELRKAARDLKVEDDLCISDIAKMPNVIIQKEVFADSRRTWPVLKKALDKALSGLVRTRRSEGSELQRDVRKRIDLLNKQVAEIKKHVPGVERRYKQRLKKRLGEAGVKIQKNDERIQKEVALFIDKSNISEEIVRLESHLKHAGKLFNVKEPVGRAMDFLCQELFREINTIGSKANDTNISRRVVLFKTELECIREQVQNVE